MTNVRPSEKVYQAKLLNLLILGAVAAPFILVLLHMGLQGLRLFPAEAQEATMRFLAGYLPILTSLTCVGGLICTFTANVDRSLCIHPKGIGYANRRTRVEIRWEDLLFTPPRPDKKPLFPSAMVSDGEQFVRFEKFFFPEFEGMCKAIAEARIAVKGEELVI